MTEVLTNAVSDVMTLVTTMLGFVTQNELLAVIFVGGTLVPLGIGIYRKFKH